MRKLSVTDIFLKKNYSLNTLFDFGKNSNPMKQYLQKITSLLALLILANTTFASTQLAGEDVALEVIAPASATAAVGDMVTFTVRVNNEGATALSALGVNVTLPNNAMITNASTANGNFNSGTGVWNIGSMLATDTSFDLTIEYTITSGGVLRVDAEVISLGQTDMDSTPNNNVATEDDQANGCVTIPLVIGCSTDIESLTLSAPSGYASYQWYKDAVAIPNEDGITYTVTESGEYFYEVVDFTGCTGIEDVIMYLYTDPDGDGDPSDGVLVLKDTTDANGYYLFEDLTPDADYVVAIGNENFGVGEPLENLTGSTGATASADNTDNGIDTVDPIFGVLSGPVSVSVDGAPTGETNLGPDGNGTLIDDNNADLTVDFGFWEPLMDLALIKSLAPGQSTDVAPGEVVNYIITVINQGDIPANNIELTDYLPTNMSFDMVANPGWSNNAGKIQRTLVAGVDLPATGLVGSIDIPISLVLNSPLMGEVSIQNFAEISSQTDLNGNFIADRDSTPDDENDDNFLIDDEVLGNGLMDGDEDDHDQASIMIKTYDLALIKQLAPGQSSEINPGDDVNFLITITNQGEISADSISIVDYFPSSFVLNDLDWTDNLNNTASITLSVANGDLTGPLTPNGGTATVEITLMANDPYTGAIPAINKAEITRSTDENGIIQEDIDSTPDSMDNDVFTTDDFIGGNGLVGADEDDHDPAEVTVNSFDLALTKVLASGQSSPVKPGDPVVFTIKVENQGQEAAGSISIVDYIPTGLILNDPLWMDNMDGTASRTLSIANGDFGSNGLVPYDDIEINISFLVDNNLPNGTLTNTAEISAGTDVSGVPQIDLDSTPDNIPGDTFITDNDVTGNGKAGGDEDDSDPATVEVQSTFDLALTKVLASGQSAGVSVGSNVNYTINVINQGDVSADVITVTDYIPTEMELTTPSPWTDNMDGTASIILSAANGDLPVGGLAPNGGQTAIDITLTLVSNLPVGTTVTNTAEISRAEDTFGNSKSDDDSNLDNIPGDTFITDNDVTGDGLNGGDEDDSDLAVVVVDAFDLALEKVLAAGQSANIEPGDDVDFTINVYNQGSIAADNITVTDYIPTEMTLNDSAWMDNMDGTASITLSVANGALPAGGLVAPNFTSVNIKLKANAPLAPSLMITNTAEISAATDDTGVAQTDVDSTPNAMNDDTFTQDNLLTGDGKNGGDEDDHDIAIVTTETFDLALIKQLASTQASTVDPGDDVTYTITLINQGEINADSITVTDYIPTGMSLAAGSAWTDNMDGTAFIVLSVANGGLNAVLGANGGTATVDLDLTVDSPYTGTATLTNTAEISAAQDDEGNAQQDIDSTPDAMNNDIFTDDDKVNGNGLNGEDEDDSDQAVVSINTFDLALTKILAAGQATTVVPGDPVTFTIEVTNQGNETADNIVITDYIPSDMTLPLGSPWTDNSNGTASIILNVGDELTAPGLEPSMSTTIDITLDVNGNTTSELITNKAEISSATNENGDPQSDIDSNLDNTDTDTFITDNDITGNGLEGGDEDDHDPASVMVDLTMYDLALFKQLAPGQSSSITSGDDVTFRISLVNQGNIGASSVTITDYIPTGFSLATGSAWMDNMDGTASITLNTGDEWATDLPANSAATRFVDLVLTSDTGLAANTILTNNAEISASLDENGIVRTDEDSSTDAMNDDTFLTDDDITGNGLQGGDEDDHDRASVTVEAFDLALIKTLATGQSTNVVPGDLVNFTIEVMNQGMVTADNIVVTDYIPTEMSLEDADWSVNPTNAQLATITLTQGNGLPIGGLVMGASVTVDITLRLSNPLPANQTITNTAEISSASDLAGNPQLDVDSSPDGVNTDNYSINDYTAGNANNGEDEDDHDRESVVTLEFDLALSKVLAIGQATDVNPGEDVVYVLNIINQGDIAADEITITDYIPAGMSLNDAAWIDNMDGTASLVLSVANGGLATALAPSVSTTATITLSVDNPYTGAAIATNTAEISNAHDANGNDQQDSDSTPNTMNDDLFVTNDFTAGNGLNGEDEDDSDQEPVTVNQFDLALDKQLAMSQASLVAPGDPVTFTITIHNQGEEAADNILISDYIPAGLILADPSWMDIGGGIAQRTLSVTNGDFATALAANGGMTSVDIMFTVDPNVSVTTLTNIAEITMATDELGEAQEDIDSYFDATNGDTFLTDNFINGDGKNGGDEDDHDPASINIDLNVMDLALAKKLSPTTPSPITPGEGVTFDIEITNQGNINANSVTITDYIPSGLTLDPTSPWTDNMDGTAEITLELGDEWATALAPGVTRTFPITFTVAAPMAAGTVITNTAEISAALDGNNDPRADQDSTPDNMDDDNYLVNDAINGNGANGGDEDDHDRESFTIAEFDLALVKTLAPGQSANITPGEDVSFEIQITNQGDIAAGFITITDYIPAELTLNDSAWMDNMDGTASRTLTTPADLGAGGLAPGATIPVTITFTSANPLTAGTQIVNTAEISSASDTNGNAQQDVDSSPDSNNFDVFTTNDFVGGDGLNGEDEDDHDREVLTVNEFDLALTKTLAAGQDSSVNPGEDITFLITVTNQGQSNSRGDYDIR